MYSKFWIANLIFNMQVQTKYFDNGKEAYNNNLKKMFELNGNYNKYIR